MLNYIVVKPFVISVKIRHAMGSYKAHNWWGPVRIPHNNQNIRLTLYMTLLLSAIIIAIIINA